MRLTSFEINAIKQNATSVFGDGVKVYLFGSRTDDNKNGGDIDLYVIPEDQDSLYEKKIKFLSVLGVSLGEQQIDVVVSKDKNRPIEKEAIATGIELNIENIKLEKILNECDKHP